MTRREALCVSFELVATASVLGFSSACGSAKQIGATQPAPRESSRPPKGDERPAAAVSENPPNGSSADQQPQPSSPQNEGLESEPPQNDTPQNDPDSENPPEELNDIKVVSGLEVGTLTAAMLREGKSVTFDHWDGEGHKIVVTEDHIKQLKRGEVVKFRTTRALYHDHGVVIDPRAK